VAGARPRAAKPAALDISVKMLADAIDLVDVGPLLIALCSGPLVVERDPRLGQGKQSGNHRLISGRGHSSRPARPVTTR